MAEPAWRVTLFERPEQAPCHQLTELFFSDDQADKERATALCGPCAMRRLCLQAALERDEPSGIWGGVNFGVKNRAALRRRARELLASA